MSPGETEDLQLRLEPVPTSVGVARHALSHFAETSGADAAAVAVAVSEVVTNAVVHAFRDSGEGTIEVMARRNGETLLVVISDDGSGIKPNPGSPGLGYGLALVASLAKEIGIAASDEGGTSVSMRFALAA